VNGSGVAYPSTRSLITQVAARPNDSASIGALAALIDGEHARAPRDGATLPDATVTVLRHDAKLKGHVGDFGVGSSAASSISSACAMRARAMRR
jgi:hypothetical protein